MGRDSKENLSGSGWIGPQAFLKNIKNRFSPVQKGDKWGYTAGPTQLLAGPVNMSVRQNSRERDLASLISSDRNLGWAILISALVRSWRFFPQI